MIQTEYKWNTTNCDSFSFGLITNYLINYFKKPIIKATKSDDYTFGIDAWIGDIPVGLRCREYQYIKYQDITIRYKNCGKKTDYDKILSGEYRSEYLIYYYLYGINRLHKVNIISVASVKKALIENNYEVRYNMDGVTALAIIENKNLEILTILKN